MAPGPSRPGPPSGGAIPAPPFISPIGNKGPLPQPPLQIFGPSQNVFPPKPGPVNSVSPVAPPAPATGAQAPTAPQVGQIPVASTLPVVNNCSTRTVEFARKGECQSPPSNACTGTWTCIPGNILYKGGEGPTTGLTSVSSTGTCNVSGTCSPPQSDNYHCLPNNMADSGLAVVSTDAKWNPGTCAPQTCSIFWSCGSGCLPSPVSTTATCKNSQCDSSTATKPTSCVKP